MLEVLALHYNFYYSSRAFKPPRSEVSLFRKGMKLESVDKRNPAVIRVASVADVLMHQIKVSAPTPS